MLPPELTAHYAKVTLDEVLSGGAELLDKYCCGAGGHIDKSESFFIFPWLLSLMGFRCVPGPRTEGLWTVVVDGEIISLRSKIRALSNSFKWDNEVWEQRGLTP